MPDDVTPQRRSVAEHATAIAALVAPVLARGRHVPVGVAALLAHTTAGAAPTPRVVAAGAAAAVDLPGFDNSQMDGYAVRGADLTGATPSDPVELPVVAPVPAGTQPPPLALGTAAPVMTGAPIPDGADAVVKIEDAHPPQFPVFPELSDSALGEARAESDNSRAAVPRASGVAWTYG